jgi:tetratricopeptide (TPR) repeat protein
MIVWAAEVALRRDSNGPEAAKGWLDQAEGDVRKLLPSQLVVSQYYFGRLQWARAAGDNSQAELAAKWLMENSTHPPYALAGMSWLAEDVERQLETADITRRGLLVARAVELYETLTKEYTRSGQSIETSSNARVARARLAEYLSQQRNYREALAAIEPLVAAFPDNADYMVVAARAHMKLDERQQAIPLWRRLSAGFPPGQPEWCEAQFNLAACVVDSDPATARRIAEQTRQLAPHMTAPWREQFEELERRLAQ